MSEEESPLQKPPIPLRGRGILQKPSTRTFTFHNSIYRKEGHEESYAKISVTESGRGQIIEPLSGAIIANRAAHDSPVPFIISTSASIDDEEEELADSRPVASKDDAFKSPEPRIHETSISGSVSMTENGEIILTPSPNSRKSKRAKRPPKTFEDYEVYASPSRSTYSSSASDNSQTQNSPEVSTRRRSHRSPDHSHAASRRSSHVNASGDAPSPPEQYVSRSSRRQSSRQSVESFPVRSSRQQSPRPTPEPSPSRSSSRQTSPSSEPSPATFNKRQSSRQNVEPSSSRRQSSRQSSEPSPARHSRRQNSRQYVEPSPATSNQSQSSEPSPARSNQGQNSETSTRSSRRQSSRQNVEPSPSSPRQSSRLRSEPSHARSNQSSSETSTRSSRRQQNVEPSPSRRQSSRQKSEPSPARSDQIQSSDPSTRSNRRQSSRQNMEPSPSNLRQSSRLRSEPSHAGSNQSRSSETSIRSSRREQNVEPSPSNPRQSSRLRSEPSHARSNQSRSNASKLEQLRTSVELSPSTPPQPRNSRVGIMDTEDVDEVPSSESSPTPSTTRSQSRRSSRYGSPEVSNLPKLGASPRPSSPIMRLSSRRSNLSPPAPSRVVNTSARRSPRIVLTPLKYQLTGKSPAVSLGSLQKGRSGLAATKPLSSPSSSPTARRTTRKSLLEAASSPDQSPRAQNRSVTNSSRIKSKSSLAASPVRSEITPLAKRLAPTPSPSPSRSTRTSIRKQRDAEALEEETSSLNQHKTASNDVNVNDKQAPEVVSVSHSASKRNITEREDNNTVSSDDEVDVRDKESSAESESDSPPPPKKSKLTLLREKLISGSHAKTDTGADDAPRKSPRKSMSRIRVAKSPRHSDLIEEESENDGANTVSRSNKTRTQLTKDRRSRTRQSLVNEHHERQTEENIASTEVDGNATHTQVFDEAMEGGHFMDHTKNISLTSKSMRIPQDLSFNVSYPKLQRHSTPLPTKVRRKKLPVEEEVEQEEEQEREHEKEEANEKVSKASKKAKDRSRRKSPDPPVEDTDEPEPEPQAAQEPPEPLDEEPPEPLDEEPPAEEPADEEPQPASPPHDPSDQEIEEAVEDQDTLSEASEGAKAKSAESTPKFPQNAKSVPRRSIFNSEPGKKRKPNKAEKEDRPFVFNSTRNQTSKSPAKRKKKGVNSYTSSFDEGTSHKATPKKRAKIVIPPPESPIADRPSDIRIYQDKESKRKSVHIRDLDVILTHVEERAWDIRESMVDRFNRAVINKFMAKVTRDIREAIADSHKITVVSGVVGKLSSEIRKMRLDLLGLQQEKAELTAEIVELKKREGSPMRCPKSIRDISTFLNGVHELREVTETLNSKFDPEIYVMYGEDVLEGDSSVNARRSLQFGDG